EGGWVTICGLWVELPLIVPQVPKGWYIPSYISIIVQLANIGPLFVTLMHRFHPGTLNETAVIYFIVGFGILASLFLAFFWSETVVVQGVEHSVPLLLFIFFIPIVDCTSSVTFLPFMMQLKAEYLMTYYVGEGLSGLVPVLVAMVQGVGVVECVNASQILKSNETHLNGSERDANYLVLFFFLMAMMVVCLVAFILLNYHPAVTRERPNNINGNGDLILRYSEAQEHTHTWMQVIYIYIIPAWVTALTNTGLASVQSYSCLPYGDQAYHWSATMANVANPIACFTLKVLMGLLTSIGSLIGVYIMGKAVMSPCPLCWRGSFFIFILSYVKVIVAVILRDEGHSALVWCGAVVQLGSMLGAVTMFPLVNIYDFFTSGDQCNTNCL
uniref:Riboflavin transporter n=1 Tax=Sinocyclocheilus rhinocerous TaxID=307959 RepID=A0A673HIP6_9TELE